jgi:hypothetical protein
MLTIVPNNTSHLSGDEALLAVREFLVNLKEGLYVQESFYHIHGEQETSRFLALLAQEDTERPSCGSAACFAGWAAVVLNLNINFHHDQDRRRLMERLGLTVEEWCYLTHGSAEGGREAAIRRVDHVLAAHAEGLTFGEATC